MAKQGMRRYKPGDGMDSNKKYGKNEAPPVPEIQGKARESKEKIAAFCLAFIQATLEKMTEKLFEQFGNLPVIFAGGVMSNSIIRNALTEKFGATFAKPEYSADNAAGIAYLAYKKYTEI